MACLSRLEELQIWKSPSYIFANLLICSPVNVFLALSKQVRVVIATEASAQRVDFGAINPKVPPLDGGSESSILQQDLLHPLADVLMHPIEGWLVAFASCAHVPPVISPRLHEFEETHEVQAAQ